MWLARWEFDRWPGVALLARVLFGILFFVLSGRVRRFGAALTATRGPLRRDLVRRTRDPVLVTSVSTRVSIGLGIPYLMTNKPEASKALLAMVMAVVLGVLAGVPAWGRGRKPMLPLRSPAAAVGQTSGRSSADCDLLSKPACRPNFYAIATNVCLDMLRSSQRRARAMDLVQASQPGPTWVNRCPRASGCSLSPTVVPCSPMLTRRTLPRSGSRSDWRLSSHCNTCRRDSVPCLSCATSCAGTRTKSRDDGAKRKPRAPLLQDGVQRNRDANARAGGDKLEQRAPGKQARVAPDQCQTVGVVDNRSRETGPGEARDGRDDKEHARAQGCSTIQVHMEQSSGATLRVGLWSVNTP